MLIETHCNIALLQTTEDYRGISGWPQVAKLATMLSAVETPWLNADQESQVIELYDKLLPYDKKSTSFKMNAKPQQTTGKFKAVRSSSVTPGLEATQRYH